ncbi:MAG: undecaprenyldiphospho-muramoylpentapeptide beta-N-acetylglucosaminyltransferase [Pseudomonadota bacterium]
MSAAQPLALLLAGGTGGHVYPAMAVALELRERGYRLGWVGTSRGLESRVVPEAGIELHTLPMRGIRGKGLLQQVQAIVMLGWSLLASLALMARRRPAVVIGMGGYASVPAALAAWLLRRPLVLQEQNAVAGSANRNLARFARRIVTGFPGVLTQHTQAEYLGNPIRREMIAAGERRDSEGVEGRALRILVLGGSLGARALNEAMPRVAAALGVSCEWHHQCGAAHVEAASAAYQAQGVTAQVLPFIEDMAEAYAWADLVVCRAGALTVAELAVMACPSVLVPLPHAIDDHQTANARFLADADAAVLLPQTELDSLEDCLRGLINQPSKLAAMAIAARGQAKPCATTDIADRVEELVA